MGLPQLTPNVILKSTASRSPLPLGETRSAFSIENLETGPRWIATFMLSALTVSSL